MKSKTSAAFVMVLLSALTAACPIVNAEELTPELQGTFEKGMAAAGQSQWALAIEYFSQVQKAAPKYTPIFFNLALAHQKAAHELPALAWFYAYLQHVPDAAEKKQIKKEILNLQVSVEAKFRNLLKEALALAQTLPVEGPSYAKPRQDAIGSVFFAFARAGMLEEAKALLPMLQGSYFSEEYATENWIATLISEGELAQAEDHVEKTAAAAQPALFGKLMAEYMNKDNLDKAISYAARIPDDKFESEYNFGTLIGKLALAGRVPEAVQYLNKFTTLDRKLDTAVETATLLAKNKKTDDAKAILALARPLYEEAAAKNPTGWDYKNLADKAAKLAEGAAEAGDTKTARALIHSVDLSKLDSQMDWTRLELVKVYLFLGDIQKAESISAAMTDASAVDFARQYLFDAGVTKKDIARAARYVGFLKATGLNPFYIGKAYADLAWLYWKAGDNANYEKLLNSLPTHMLDGKPDPAFNRNVFFMQLCSLAEEEGDRTRYDTFLGMIHDDVDNYVRAQVIRLTAYRLEKAGKSREAGEVLFNDMTIFERGNSYHVLDSLGFDIVKAYLEAGDKVAAKAALDQMLALAIKENYTYNDALGRIRELYLKLGEPAEAARIQKERDDALWVSQAQAFEGDADLMDPDLYLRKIQSEAPEAIPGKMSSLAERYSASLRRIERLAKG